MWIVAYSLLTPVRSSFRFEIPRWIAFPSFLGIKRGLMDQSNRGRETGADRQQSNVFRSELLVSVSAPHASDSDGEKELQLPVQALYTRESRDSSQL